MTTPKKEPLHTFFDDPKTDVLISTILSLTTELSVTRERLDTLERILEQNGAIQRDAIETYEAPPPAAKERAVLRQGILTNVVQKMNAYFHSSSKADR
ncbi:MAG: hypothetical protein AAGC77_07110 [Pseudomonadota bacterium]